MKRCLFAKFYGKNMEIHILFAFSNYGIVLPPTIIDVRVTFC
jgi:hypothetical protein